MERMERNKVLALLQNLERIAEKTLAKDASFLEALHTLKSEVDSDSRVRAAKHALRNRGLIVFSSFVPRIRIRLNAGENVLPSDAVRAAGRSDTEQIQYRGQTGSDPVTQGVRDAASAVVGSSAHCRELNQIVNEALQANAGFERTAGPLERAGYQLDICIDLSTYARVYEGASQRPPSMNLRASTDRQQQSEALTPGKRWHLPLSGQDMEFLKRLRISP